MQKYFDIFLRVFVNLKYFPLKPKVFLHNHPFQAFLVSKTYIFIHVKKKLRKIERPLTAGEGVQGLIGHAR